ncbi:fl(2)d-associated complex component [Musca autumnalis]|uniref:fl(2)d-associated complex component n=1 Tax=Musca autumnalis TaxID=221902 RepID=UPI003CEA4F58
MDKKSKEALRRYKKARKAAESSSESSSSSSDSSSESSSYSSEDERRHRSHKKERKANARSSSSSGDERHKREKERRCQKKLEAKRNHLKRKLKEAKLKKKAALALSGHSHRALSPATQAKLKKLAERKHLRAASKERREREKEKHRALRERERGEREHHHRSSRSPTKITKIRIHQDVPRQKTPPRVHHQLMSREKIIIQTRTRDRTPSAERERLRHEKMRHEDMARERERREREAAREKERAEALARCQERQRERERLAREKLRREEEEKYGKPISERLLARGPERDMGGRGGFEPRDRSLERTKRDMDPYEHGYERKHRTDDYEEERERRAILEREELLREREYLARRREMSPSEYPGSSGSRMRTDPRDIYPEDDRERAYKRPFIEEGGRGGGSGREPWLSEREIRAREMHDPRDYREMEPEHLYPEERDRLPPPRERERGYVGRPGSDWKRKEWMGSPREWPTEEPGPSSHSSARGFGGPKRGTSSVLPGKIPPPSIREQRPQSETDWDAEEGQIEVSKKPEPNRDTWLEHDKRDLPESREKIPPSGRPWDWREREEATGPPSYSRGPPGPMMHHPRSERGGRGGYRRGGHIIHGERVPGIHGFRAHHPPALLSLPTPGGGFHEGSPRFPNKRNMTYTNPNILKKQQAALAAANTAVAAAKAAAQSAASGTTNPSILGQAVGTANRTGQATDDKPEAGEIVGEAEDKQNTPSNTGEGAAEQTEQSAGEAAGAEKEKKSGELSEISDSDDDILNKTEKKAKLDNEDSNSQTKTATDKEANEEKGDEEEIMDFEEISDGELEEERAAKGVGDALGVDWSSLVAETKRLPSCPTTSAKEKWQPHRIILDIGISMRMAGEEYAKQLLANAKQQLEEEVKDESNLKTEIKDETTIKSEIKDEVSSLSTLDEDSQTPMENDENTSDIKPKEEKPELKPLTETINIDNLPPLACMQVAQRKLQMERNNLINNACGVNSRALSARQDLKLRRQLCGLPARECPISRNIPATSDKLKAMALAAFQRTLEVK